MRVIGLDAHRSMSVVAVLEKGHLTSGGRIDLTRDAVIAFGGKLRPDGECQKPRFRTSRICSNNTSFQKIRSANRKITIANMAKNAAISPPTTQKPFGLPLNGIPPTFMPQIPAISVAGRNIAENVVSM
jgi:hypothetical protein